MSSVWRDGEGLLSFDQGTLVLRGWTPAGIAQVFPPYLWRWDHRVEAWRTEAYRYAEVEAFLASKATGTVVETPQWQPVHFDQVVLPSLRAEQTQAVEQWLEAKRGVVVMPTGTGKTEVALKLLSEARCSALVVAPIRDLMYQWHQRILRGLHYDAGLIGDSHKQIKPISVATYDSACIHMPELGNRFRFLIFDECHHLPGRIRSDAARMAMAPWRLGLTATLERADGKHVDLQSLIGPVVYRLELPEVRGKSLAEYTVYRVPIHLETQEQVRYDKLGEEIQHYVYDRMQADSTFTWKTLCAESVRDPESRRVLRWAREKQSIEDRAEGKLRIMEDLFRLHHGSPIIVFVGSNAMARDVSARFLIPCLLNHCGKKERLDYLEGLRDGVYPAIVANQVLDEGVDIPAVKVAIVVGGKSSSKQAKQRLGRILRRSGDEKAVLYEVVATDTNESMRSRKRRDNDAYSGTRHRRV